MDNFTHSLTAWALGQTGLKQKTRKGLAALILAANMADIDVFFGHSCWVPLATHRGFTHSLVGGLLVMPPLLAALLWLLDRWQLGRGASFRSGLAMRPGWLLLLCYIGALTHPLLDWQTSYAIQLFSPFSDMWFHAESLFIIDVWIWVALALAIAISRRRERKGHSWRAPAIIGLASVCAYIFANQALTSFAKAEIRQAGRDPETLFAQFEPVVFWKRGLVYRDAGQVGFASWSPFSGYRELAPPVPDHMGEPIVRRAKFATPELRRFMRWSVMPMATVAMESCQAIVRFTDARFAHARLPWRDDGNPFNHKVLVRLDGPQCDGTGNER